MRLGREVQSAEDFVPAALEARGLVGLLAFPEPRAPVVCRAVRVPPELLLTRVAHAVAGRLGRCVQNFEGGARSRCGRWFRTLNVVEQHQPTRHRSLRAQRLLLRHHTPMEGPTPNSVARAATLPAHLRTRHAPLGVVFLDGSPATARLPYPVRTSGRRPCGAHSMPMERRSASSARPTSRVGSETWRCCSAEEVYRDRSSGSIRITLTGKVGNWR